MNLVKPDELSNTIMTRSSLKSLYFSDNRPWVVAYSGGKDSTVVLQLVFEMLISLGADAHKPIFVVSSDTQVEAPNVAKYVVTSLDKVQGVAKSLNLPLTTHIVRPRPEESFWGKLIGKGYPPPSRWFRWCTSNMKIKPSRRVVEEITRNYGSVILILGTRVSESVQRGRTMQAREINSKGLNPHHEIPNALVATPIANWAIEDVWEYLSTENCPWGSDHGYLISLYRQANGGECPIIFDLSTPSCGGSRFGCWTCTVVKEDKSLQGFIRSGEEHLQPLIDFRNWLIELRDLSGYRSGTKRNGSAGPGPFLPSARQEILKKLFALEKQTGLALVSNNELGYIQREWAREFDFQDNLAVNIAMNYGRNIAVTADEYVPDMVDDLLEQAALMHGINSELVYQMLDLRRCEFPSLDKWGAKTNFERAVGDLLEKAARQAEQIA